ncbi:hypothetical protein HOY82DRAFT_220262 [Tuber indicum]|nr:hypothetical protein HOY82DRAFT_220262 [Tuber indicum]
MIFLFWSGEFFLFSAFLEYGCWSRVKLPYQLDELSMSVQNSNLSHDKRSLRVRFLGKSSCGTGPGRGGIGSPLFSYPCREASVQTRQGINLLVRVRVPKSVCLSGVRTVLYPVRQPSRIDNGARYVYGARPPKCGNMVRPRPAPPRPIQLWLGRSTSVSWYHIVGGRGSVCVWYRIPVPVH